MVSELVLAGLAVGVAAVYFTIAAMVVPRIALPEASRRYTLLFRGGAVAFFVGCGLTHIHIAVHAISSDASASAHEIAFHSVQLVGGWLFVFAALRYLDVVIQPRATADEMRVRELEHLALRDPLTGVHNRRFFDEALDNEVRRHHRYGSPLAIILADVDNLKEINDIGGHAAGDWALRNIAATAKNAVRAADNVVRFGGDEFAILLPETDQDRAWVVAERLRADVARLSLPVDAGLTVSVGLAAMPQDAMAAEDLLAKADGALYWAKAHGKNRSAAAGDAAVAEG